MDEKQPSESSVARNGAGASVVLEPSAWLDGDHRLARAVRDLLANAHAKNAKRPIEGPDEYGTFPESGQQAWGLLGAGVPPVVVDANALRNDVIPACRTGRTVLITAANAGAIRLYAASHVIREVGEHSGRWARESGDVSPSTFRARWEAEYLPLLRVVQDEDICADLLDPEERQRVARLASVDRDDVPSAILSLVLGAFFLSTDRRALRAVYGAEVDLKVQRQWAEILKPSGDAGELDKLVFAAGMLPMLAGAGIVQAVRWASGKLSQPWLLVPIGVGLIGLLRLRVPSERWQKLGGGLGELAAGFAYLYMRYQRAYEQFGEAAPAVPRWSQLSQEIERRAVLTRACMHGLARSPGGHRSARELAAELPILGVGQGEALVREALRGNSCFDQPREGRWQLGRAVGSSGSIVRQRPHPKLAAYSPPSD